MNKIHAIYALLLLIGCNTTGVAKIEYSYIRKNTASSTFREDFCRAVETHGVRCTGNDNDRPDFIGTFYSDRFGENFGADINGWLEYREGTPIYELRPVFQPNKVTGEAIQARFWEKVLETLGSYGYGASDKPSFVDARNAFLAQQAAEAERAEIEKRKQDAKRSKVLVALSSPRSCQSLKSSYLKCVKAATDQKWKSNTMIWNDFKQAEMMMPGSACGLICTVEVMESCVRVGFAKFPKDFLDPETCASVCSKCWFN